MDGPLQKLYNAGLKGNLSLFIQNFCIDRKIKVRLGNSYSDLYGVQKGIPQGTVFSSSCFMIALNDINDSLSSNIHFALSVDDYVIYASGSIAHVLERRPLTAINKLSQ